MLYIDVGAVEQCEPDKGRLRVVCPDVAWVHYVLSGKGTYNGTVLGRGEGFAVYQNDRCEYAPDPEEPWKYVWIRLAGEDTEGLLARSDLPGTSGTFRFGYAERLESLATVLFAGAEGWTDSRGVREASAKLILSLHGDRGGAEGDGRSNVWVEQAKEYIALHYHRRIRVEEIARALHIDRKYLRNLFVRHTGMSTAAYLLDYRMTRAKTLLTAADVTVGEVAASVGYDDPLAFSKAFKKHVGLSPTAYRQRAIGVGGSPQTAVKKFF